jgi:DNA mismatch repair protein MutL
VADIRLLPAELVHKIAAGEVIERPASVVKELTENALDAGATRISITVEDGGRYINVADNGSGMTPDNLRKAFVNHATSKLPVDDQLFAISSLGFRGEALASISAIAKVTCHTRTLDAADGHSLQLEPGQPPREQVSGCAVGTSITVADLFYTTPARLKFLKKPQTELAHIQELVECLALSQPAVRFTLTVTGKTTLDTPGNGELTPVVSHIFEPANWLPVDRQDDGMHLTGLVTPPTVQKATKRWLVMLVNGRTVKCPVLSRAIESAYEQILPPKRYPIAVLNLSLPYDQVDVNVHPSKREVRYANGQAVFSMARAAIQQALSNKGFWQQAGFIEADHSHIPTMHTSPVQAMGAGARLGYATAPAISPWQQAKPLFLPLNGPVTSQSQHAPDPLAHADGNPPPQFRVIGQLFLTYMLVETVQGLMVVDQHIASERVLFEQLGHQLLDSQPQAIQPLLVPLQHRLRPLQAERLQPLIPDLTRLGLQLTMGDDHHLIVTAIPALLQDRLPPQWLDDLINRLDASDAPAQLPLHDVVATLSCHAAVRAGDVLSLEAMTRLMADWLACVLPWSCPHGRPIAHTIATKDLNRFFERPSLPAQALHALKP